MKDTFKLEENFFDLNQAKSFAALYAEEAYDEELECVLLTALQDKRNLPSLRFKPNEVIMLKPYVERWVNAYLRGKENRPSKRVGKASNVYPDGITKQIFHTLFPKLEEKEVNKIEIGHSIFMTIENITGDLLEEYLDLKLKPHKWYCCWGSSVDAVDFCTIDGRTLQIKNSDNSENSSSSRVRADTVILKWYRRISTKENKYNWEELQKITGCKDLTESDFNSFVTKTIKANPNCVFVNTKDPFGPKQTLVEPLLFPDKKDYPEA